MIQLAPKSNFYMSYDAAFLYCLTLEYNGHKDWRLPTWNEMMSLPIRHSWYEGRGSTNYDWAATPVREQYDD